MFACVLPMGSFRFCVGLRVETPRAIGAAITCRWKCPKSFTRNDGFPLSEAAMQAAALAVAEETVPSLATPKNGFGKLLRDFWLLETQPKMDEIGL